MNFVHKKVSVGESVKKIVFIPQKGGETHSLGKKKDI